MPPQPTLEQRTDDKPIASPLLYTTESEEQAFVHDTLGEFFLARWLAQDSSNADRYWQRLEELMDSKKEDSKDIAYFIREISSLKQKNALDIIIMFASMVPDATYFIRRGIQVARRDTEGNISYFCTKEMRKLDINDPINKRIIAIGMTLGTALDVAREHLAYVMMHANSVAPETIDEALAIILPNWLEERSTDALLLVHELRLDPFIYFRKIYGDEEKAINKILNVCDLLYFENIYGLKDNQEENKGIIKRRPYIAPGDGLKIQRSIGYIDNLIKHYKQQLGHIQARNESETVNRMLIELRHKGR